MSFPSSKRCALFILGLSLAACQQPNAPRVLPDKTTNPKNVGIVIFNDLFITEFTAPHDIYHHVPADKVNVFSVAPTMDEIKTYESIRIQPDFSFDNAPRIDILVVPSGNGSLTSDLNNTALVDFVRARGATAEYVTSHCWGAFTLAKAGLLDGKRATTFPTYEDELQSLFPGVTVVTTARWVEDGNMVTSNGGLAAYEAALHMTERIWGTSVADTVASGLVFAAGNRAYSIDPAR